MELLAIITVCLAALAVLVFFLGPWILARFFEKADEWAEIIDSMKGENGGGHGKS